MPLHIIGGSALYMTWNNSAVYLRYVEVTGFPDVAASSKSCRMRLRSLLACVTGTANSNVFLWLARTSEINSCDIDVLLEGLTHVNHSPTRLSDYDTALRSERRRRNRARATRWEVGQKSCLSGQTSQRLV
jgi:hypothetical protein